MAYLNQILIAVILGISKATGMFIVSGYKTVNDKQ